MTSNCYFYLDNIGTKLKLYRANLGLTQQDLSNKSGVSVRSISRLEQGASVQLDSFIRILIALNLDSNIEMLVPDQTQRPSFYLKEDSNYRIRARKDNKKGEFKWGDEI